MYCDCSHAPDADRQCEGTHNGFPRTLYDSSPHLEYCSLVMVGSARNGDEVYHPITAFGTIAMRTTARSLLGLPAFDPVRKTSFRLAMSAILCDKMLRMRTLLLTFLFVLSTTAAR